MRLVGKITQTFLNADGGINQETVGVKTTKILCDYGMQNSKGIQKVGDITIYPKEYFNPLNNNTGVYSYYRQCLESLLLLLFHSV